MQGADILTPLDMPPFIMRMRISKGACTAARLAYINRTLFAKGQSRNKPLNTLIRSCLFRGSYRNCGTTEYKTLLYVVINTKTQQ